MCFSCLHNTLIYYKIHKFLSKTLFLIQESSPTAFQEVVQTGFQFIMFQIIFLLFGYLLHHHLKQYLPIPVVPNCSTVSVKFQSYLTKLFFLVRFYYFLTFLHNWKQFALMMLSTLHYYFHFVIIYQNHYYLLHSFHLNYLHLYFHHLIIQFFHLLILNFDQQ